MSENYLSAEILMDMTNSIKHVESYSEALDGLDAKLGSLEGKLNAVSSSLNRVAETKKANLRTSIEKQLNDVVKANGVVLEDVGSDSFKIKADVIKKINRRIESEINTTLAEQAENIKMKIDPSYKKALTTTISSEHFDSFNNEVANMIKNQMQNIKRQLKDAPIADTSKIDVNAISLTIGKQMVQSTITTVKDAIKPIITNPKVVTEGVALNIPKRQAQVIVNKVMKEIMNSLDNVPMQQANIPYAQLFALQGTISRLVTDQINAMNSRLRSISLDSLEKPINELNKKTRQIIAKQLDTSVEELEKANMTVNNGYISEIRIKQAFDSLGEAMNRQLGKFTNQFAKDIIEQIKTVSFDVQPSIVHELNNDLNRINRALVKKIKEQVDVQIAHIIAEIEAAGVAPGKLNSRNVASLGRIGTEYRPGKSTINNNTTVVNNYGSGGNKEPRTSIVSGSDPYARRDNYFNNFGLEGALKNTFRHILAGSMIGAPIMAIYEAMNTFKETQLEMLKVYQNYYMQDYVANDGDVNKGQIQADVSKLNDVVKKMSVFYGVDYTQMSEVGAIASRLTESPDESRKFMDVAAQILRIDNSGDIVKDIAPGLEAIMLQFGMRVWELNRVVAAFAVATNVTKASTEELMAGLSRSGSSFAGAGITMEQATMMMAGALQTTGLSASDLGNMFKTLNQRLSMPTVQKTLEEQGLSVYDENNNRIPGVQLWQEVANIVANPHTPDKVVDELLGDMAGMYQVGKLRAFIGSMNTLGVEVKDEEGKVYEPFKLNERMEAVDFSTDEKMQKALSMVHDLLGESLNNPAIAMDRAGVAVNVALTSMLEEMAPQIQRLADVVVNASNVVQNNSDKLAQLGTILLNAAVGFGAFHGIKWGLNKGGFQEHMGNYRMQDKLYGNSRAGMVSTVAPIFDLLGDGLSDIGSRNSNTFKMLSMAKASPGIENVFARLAEMDEVDVKRALDYNDDYRGGKRIETFAELDRLLAESADYFTGDMDDDERRMRSKQNVGNLMNSTKDTKIFADEFANALRDFDIMTATPETRRMFDSFARMNDERAGVFSQYLATESVRNGTRIRNVDDLSEVYGRFQDVQATRVDVELADDVGANRLNNRYRDMMSEVDSQDANKGNGLGGLVATFGNGARSIGKSLGDLGKTAGRLAGQFTLLMAAGSVLLEWMENATLTAEQKAVRDVEKEVDMYKQMHNFESTVWGKDVPMFDRIWTAVSSTFDWGMDAILDLVPGIDRKGLDDVMWNEAKYMATLQKLFKTTDIDEIKEKEGLNDDEIIAKVLDEMGLNAKLDEANKNEYNQRYHDFMEDQNKQLEQQKEAEMAREAYNQKLLEETPYLMGIQELVDMINKEIESIDKETNIGGLDAVLSGLSTTSQAYYDIMLEGIRKQIEAYENGLKYYDDSIRLLEENIKFMEDEGTDKTDADTYKKLKEDLAETKTQRDEFYAEIEEPLKEARVKEMETAYNKRKQAITDRQQEYNDENFYTDYDIEMNTGEGTDERGSALRDKINRQIQQEKDILAMYEELAAYDVNGETDELIREQKRKIADFNKEYFASYQQDLSEYSKNIDRVGSKNAVELLRAQVASGITDSDDPALKGIRMTLLGKELATINGELAKAQATLADLIEQDASQDIINDYEDKLLDLERQSLEVQLEQLSEMKSQKGTFNLPDGIKVMSELDYKMGQSSHSQYSIQQGETYVTVVLPNVTGNTNQNTLNNIGRALGDGISNGRLSSYRTQISGNPNSYRVLY